MRHTLASMEVTVRLEPREIQAAVALTGIADPAQLIPHVLREFLHARVVDEVSRISGTDPQATAAPRSRTQGPAEPPCDPDPPTA